MSVRYQGPEAVEPPQVPGAGAVDQRIVASISSRDDRR
jgi:hypothetical protein